MSTPEWMKKFQEIGQKGEEEVTTVGDQGFVKTAEPKKAPDATQTSIESSEQQSSSGAASGSRGESTKSYVSQDPPEGSSSNAVSSDEASSSSDEASSDGVDSEDAVDEVSGVETPTATTASQAEEMGESWVVDKDKAGRASDIDSEAAADAGRQSYNPGESFITEEVLVDEDGNEILVDEDGNEIQVDENGNEIIADEDDEEVEVDENGDEIQEEEVPDDEDQEQDISPNVYETAAPTAYAVQERTAPQETAPVYDIEEQREILGVGKKGSSSRMSWCIPVMVFAMIVASVLLVLFFVVWDRASFDVSPTMAPTPINNPDSGSGSIDAAATTEFDPIKNDCSLSSTQPSIIDQCKCNGEVNILADDTRARWESLAQNFISSVYPEWDEPTNSCSPENQALLWLSSGINNGGEIDDLRRRERYILAVVYYQNGGSQWSRSFNWLSERSVCDWEGVECNSDLYVRILNLDQNKLTGELSDTATLLNAIEAYFVANNDLVGSIPDAYFNDDSLRYIDFSGNSLSGEIFSDVSEDSKLISINFASNSLSGPIIGRIRKLTDLEVLNIESNDFSGTLPSKLFTLNLTELSVGGNEFTGTIPGQLPKMSTLTSLSLGPNKFTGDIPTSLKELTALKKLSIVGIPDLGGRLPASYGLNLTDLVELSIAETNVDGDIPDLYAQMTKLETLQLNNNNIRGRIPRGLSLLTNLKSLSLQGNALTGDIPSELGLLTSIRRLHFHSNGFTGTIPDEFGNLVEIRTLTFDNTFMSGRVPNGVCALRNAELDKLIVDCPTLVGQSQVDGIICSVPDCCTECL